jgi:hypothetical protein
MTMLRKSINVLVLLLAAASFRSTIAQQPPTQPKTPTPSSESKAQAAKSSETETPKTKTTAATESNGETVSDDVGQAIIVVVGASGADEFAPLFREWAGRWKQAAERADAESLTIGLEESGTADRDQLKAAIEKFAQPSPEPLWIVLIGHGTFNGRAAKFNMRGRDVSAVEMAEWLKSVKRPIAVINSASASGPFVNRLSTSERVIVTASKSGYEHNFARFGDHLSQAVLGDAADLDKDGQTSLLEAFLSASGRVAEFYRQEGRLATEHALLDDNGDKMGTPATFFRGVRAVKSAKKGAAIDGLRASQFVLIRSESERSLSPEQRAARDRLENQIEQLRKQKSTLDVDQYYRSLEELLTQLSAVLLD